MTKRYFIEIKKTGDTYTRIFHQGIPAAGNELSNLNLGANAVLTIRDQQYQLGPLIKDLVEATPDNHEEFENFFDARGQVDIGTYLCNEAFSKIDLHSLKNSDETVDLRIITSDEHIAILPWVLLYHKGEYLTALGWSISISNSYNLMDCTCSPAILIIAPEPKGKETGASEHIEQITNTLPPEFEEGKNLKIISTLEEFYSVREEKSFSPTIIYYYGHGTGNKHTSSLLFSKGDKHESEDLSMTTFAEELKKMKELQLVYLNCCKPNAGGFLGAGWLLKSIPSVISNRTIAETNTAQAQALILFENIFKEGKAPHEAMLEIRGSKKDDKLSPDKPYWFNPVLYCCYREWEYKAPEPPQSPESVPDLGYDPDWKYKLNRFNQFGRVTNQTGRMLQKKRPRSLACAWFGKKGQGFNKFLVGVKKELERDHSGKTRVILIQPYWEDICSKNPDSYFANMLIEAFDNKDNYDVQKLDNLPHSIEQTDNRQKLIYVYHKVNSTIQKDLQILKSYLLWWNNTFLPLFEENNCYFLLSISFEIEDTTGLKKNLDEAGINELDLNNTRYFLLDEMKSLEINEVFDSLEDHNISLAPEYKKRLQKIIEKTGGVYDETVKELIPLIETG